MNRRGSRSVAQASATTSTVSVAAQLEHDRLVREQEIRTRISRQHAESERLRSEQHEREQRDRQRAEYERLTHEQHERDRIARERIAFDRTDRDSATFTLADSTSTMSDSNHLVRERLERERLEHERLDRERIERERNQHDRLEYERTERERILRERLEHERIERERIRTHREYDVSHNSAAAVSDSDVRDVVDSSLTEAEPEPETGTVKKRRGGGWGWPRRRKTADSTETQSEVHSEDIDPPISDEVIDDVLPSDDAPNGDDVSRKTSGWGRQRKRGRNLRDSTGE